MAGRQRGNQTLAQASGLNVDLVCSEASLIPLLFRHRADDLRGQLRELRRIQAPRGQRGLETTRFYALCGWMVGNKAR